MPRCQDLKFTKFGSLHPPSCAEICRTGRSCRSMTPSSVFQTPAFLLSQFLCVVFSKRFQNSYYTQGHCINVSRRKNGEEWKAIFDKPLFLFWRGSSFHQNSRYTLLREPCNMTTPRWKGLWGRLFSGYKATPNKIVVREEMGMDGNRVGTGQCQQWGYKWTSTESSSSGPFPLGDPVLRVAPLQPHHPATLTSLGSFNY